MADEPQGPDDEPVETEKDRADAQVSALAELALCENLAQTSGWAARWSASMAGADATLLWAPDTVHPLFLCIGAEGEGVEKFLRRSAPRDSGYIRDLVRDRQPIVLTGEELATNDPFVRGLPGYRACIAVPLEAEGLVVGLLAIFFTEMPDAEVALARLEALSRAGGAGAGTGPARRAQDGRHAPRDRAAHEPLRPVQGVRLDDRRRRAVRSHRSQGRRLRHGRDGLPLDARRRRRRHRRGHRGQRELRCRVSAGGRRRHARRRRHRRPAGDPPQPDPRDRPGRDGEPRYPVRSVLAVPLVEDEVSIGALVVANKRGRHPEFSAEDEELLHDLARQAVRALRTARQHEAEKKVEELDALLAVSREITATLDLDKVMQTIVNATAALIAYDRCGIAIQEKGKLRLGRDLRLGRNRPQGPRASDAWRTCSSGSSCPVRDAAVTQTEDGDISADRPETRGEVSGALPGDGAAVLLRRPAQGRGGQARRSRLREPRATRLRRGDAGPALNPGQPGDGRRPQRAALPASTARRLLEAAAREAAEARRHAESPADEPGRSASASPPSSCSWSRGRYGSPAPRGSYRAGAPPSRPWWTAS